MPKFFYRDLLKKRAAVSKRLVDMPQLFDLPSGSSSSEEKRETDARRRASVLDSAIQKLMVPPNQSAGRPIAARFAFLAPTQVVKALCREENFANYGVKLSLLSAKTLAYKRKPLKFAKRLQAGSFGSVSAYQAHDGAYIAFKHFLRGAVDEREVDVIKKLQKLDLDRSVVVAARYLPRLKTVAMHKYNFTLNDLKTAVQARPYTVNSMMLYRSVVEAVAKSLRYVWTKSKKKLVYMDMKPRNVLVRCVDKDKTLAVAIGDLGGFATVDQRAVPTYPHWFLSKRYDDLTTARPEYIGWACISLYLLMLGVRIRTGHDNPDHPWPVLYHQGALNAVTYDQVRDKILQRVDRLRLVLKRGALEDFRKIPNVLKRALGMDLYKHVDRLANRMFLGK